MVPDSTIPSTDRSYWSQREAQERLAAAQSLDPAARRVHAMLADGYAARLRDAARID